MPVPDYSRIKQSTLDSLQRYAEHHIPTGDFLHAVLANDLRDAFGRADEENCEALFHIAAYCYNEMPGASWGSPEKVQAWLNARKVAS